MQENAFLNCIFNEGTTIMRINYVLPLLMGTAFLIFGVIFPLIMPEVSNVWKYSLLAVGVVLLVISYFFARNGSTPSQPRGGRGGAAKATGEDTDALGGAGGNANGGTGGNGGNAYATGKGARARGGAGGSG
jgi:hypothetical protein